MIRSGIGELTLEVELRTVTGAGKDTLGATDAKGTAHVRTDARQRPQPIIAIEEEPLDGTRSEGVDGAVEQVDPGRDRVPASVGTHQRFLDSGWGGLERPFQTKASCDPCRERAQSGQEGSAA